MRKLSYEEHRRLCQIHMEHDYSIASAHKVFQLIVPGITYDQTRSWLMKPLMKELVLEVPEDWFFLGCLCSIKNSLIKSHLKLPKSMNVDLKKYLHNKYIEFCNGEKIYADTISYDSLIDLINDLTEKLVLETSRSDIDKTDRFHFIKGYLFGSCTLATETDIKIPINTMFLPEILEHLKPITYKKHYSTYVFNSYSARKFYDFLRSI